MPSVGPGAEEDFIQPGWGPSRADILRHILSGTPHLPSAAPALVLAELSAGQQTGSHVSRREPNLRGNGILAGGEGQGVLAEGQHREREGAQHILDTQSRAAHLTGSVADPTVKATRGVRGALESQPSWSPWGISAEMVTCQGTFMKNLSFLSPLLLLLHFLLLEGVHSLGRARR